MGALQGLRRENYGGSVGFGILRSPATGEAKGLPGMGLQPLLYCQYMMYAVMWHCICHLSETWYDAHDIMSPVTPVHKGQGSLYTITHVCASSPIGGRGP